MLDNNDIVCFLALARNLNFTKTARELFMSQQAVSQRISRIEQDIGFPLFLRSRSYVRLTKAGDTLRNFLERAEGEYQDILAQCRKDFEEVSSTLRVGYQNMLAWNMILGSAQEDFAAQNLGVQIIGELHDSYVLIEKLISRKLHMIILYNRFAPNSGEFEKLEIRKMPLLLMVSKKKAINRDGVSYMDYRNLPMIEDVFGKENAEYTLRRARNTAALCNLEPSDFILVPNRDTANMAAEAGRGIIIGTEFGVAYKSENLKSYPTGVNESLICMWNIDEENIMVQRYARFIQKAQTSID